MRGLFWVLALFALATGLSLAARYNDGYVIFFVNPARIEMALSLFILLTVVLFVLLYFFIRAAAYTLGLPERVRAFRAARTKEKARHSLFDALLSSLEGRYARAEKSAAAAHASGEEPGLAALLAARAAHQLEHPGERDAWVERAMAATQPGAVSAPGATAQNRTSQLRKLPLQHAILMTRAEFLAQQRRDAEALDVLAELNRSGARHIASQRLALKSMTRAGRWEDALKVAHRLEEHKALHPAVAAKTREAAYAALFASGDADDLRERLRRLPRADRRNAAIARHVSAGLVRAGLMREAQEVMETALDHEWDSALAAQLADCVLEDERDITHQLERAERWQAAHPRDAGLLLSLGRLCARQKLWGKAQRVLEDAARAAPSRPVWLELAMLMEATGQIDAANRHYKAAAQTA